MNSEELIHRIVRVLEGGDAWEDGAGLAAEYAEKVRGLGRRMEAVERAQAKGEYGEAMRLMEERPRLLDEIGVLDFHQWGPWKGKCAEKGWETPPAVDSPTVERLLEAYNNSAAMDALLKEYRKAVRMHDIEGQVRALRPLAKGPGGADWADALRGAEEAWAEELGRRFDAATGAGNDGAAAEAADEVLCGEWTVLPDEALRNRTAVWKDMKASVKRQAALAGCMERLKELSGGTWDLARAGAAVREACHWMGQGAVAGIEEAALIDRTEARVKQETEAAEAAERRLKNEDALRAALQAGDAEKAAEVLDSPEVRDGNVDGDLLREAEGMVEAAAMAHWRRMRLLAVGLLLLLGAAAGAAGYTYTMKQREARCAEACGRLEKASKDARPWAVLEAQLQALERDDPKVYAMDAVRKYDKALKDIQSNRANRRELASRQLAELDELAAEGWKGGGDEAETDGRVEAVRRLLDGDMAEENARLAALEQAWNAEKDARREGRLAEARKAMPALREEKERLAEVLGRTYLNDTLAGEADAWQEKASEWERQYGEIATADGAEIAVWAGELDAARKMSADALAAVKHLQAATGAVAVVEARVDLRDHYGNYPGVEAMGDLPVTAEQVAAALGCELPEQKNVSRLRRAISNEEGWKDFLETQVWPAAEIPELAELYGIDQGFHFEAISIGKCRLSPPGSSMTAKGNLLWLMSEEMVKELDFAPRAHLKQYQVLLPPCDELQDVVGASRAPRMTPGRFTALLYERIAKHIEAAHGPAVPPLGDWTYYKAESGEPKSQPLQAERYPAYKRVQMMDLYFGWLERMGALHGIGAVRSQLVEQCRRLAEPIPIGGIDPALSWTCLENARVAKRNKECAGFLLRMPEDFSRQCLEMQSERQKLQAIAFWQLGYAGKIPFQPEKELPPAPAPGIRADHPLYVMRSVGGHVVCKAILRPESGAWKATDVKGISGEPLFQFKINGAYADAEAELRKTLAVMSEESQRYFRNCNYLVEVEE